MVSRALFKFSEWIQPNFGVGNLSDLKSGEETEETINEFYNTLANYANHYGVTVDLLSIEGAEWDLETLITLSEKTGGDVDIINPCQTEAKLDGLINKKNIANKVKISIHLHRSLEFKNENFKNFNRAINTLEMNLGNVYQDTEVTFEYKFKEPFELNNFENFYINKLDQVPFQIVIEYTKPNGTKSVRVITHIQKTSDNLEEVLNEVKLEILASNASQQASKIAKDGTKHLLSLIIV